MKRTVILSALVLGTVALAGTASAHERDFGGRGHGDAGRHHGEWRRDHDERRWGYGYYRPMPRYYAAPRFREYRPYREYYVPRPVYYPDDYVYVEPVVPRVALSFFLPLR